MGSQDQTNASFGGFNHILFMPGNRIIVNPIILSKKKHETLRSHLMLFLLDLQEQLLMFQDTK